jgi:26S proteasome regulatory subunit N2
LKLLKPSDDKKEVTSSSSDTDIYNTLLAFQIAFDLEANATQEFLHRVISNLPVDPSKAPAPPVTAAESNVVAEVSSTEAAENAMQVDESSSASSNTSTLAAPSASAPIDTISTPNLTRFDDALSKVHRILSGDVSVHLYLDFLFRNNRTDMLILKKTKDMLETRSSVFHQAITVSNAFMSCGTTSDEFLKSNLQWLAKATNWTKFVATAGFGVIHKVGHGNCLRSLNSFT